VDPTSDETEAASTQTVRKLVDTYRAREKEMSGSTSVSLPKPEDKQKEQWPLLAMFRNLDNQPGPLKQFWILYRLGLKSCLRSL